MRMKYIPREARRVVRMMEMALGTKGTFPRPEEGGGGRERGEVGR